MPAPAISEQVNRRLRELYERHLPLEQGSVAAYYEPGRGYYEAELANEETFSVSLADLDGGAPATSGRLCAGPPRPGPMLQPFEHAET